MKMKHLRSMLSDAVAHVKRCPLCRGKGFVCEFCQNSNDIIFPFELHKIRKCRGEEMSHIVRTLPSLSHTLSAFSPLPLPLSSSLPCSSPQCVTVASTRSVMGKVNCPVPDVLDSKRGLFHSLSLSLCASFVPFFIIPCPFLLI